MFIKECEHILFSGIRSWIATGRKFPSVFYFTTIHGLEPAHHTAPRGKVKEKKRSGPRVSRSMTKIMNKDSVVISEGLKWTLYPDSLCSAST